MFLTDEEKEMLEGIQGYGPQVGMKILVALGKVYDAEKLIPVHHAHVAGLGYNTFGMPGVEWLEELVQNDAHVKITTTLNSIGVDRSADFPLPEDIVFGQMRINEACVDMGCMALNCCTPYWCGFIPRLGESVAWSESSAVVYANSVLGARDNREGGQSSLAAALTGRTPYYGLHLNENRRGSVLVKIVDKPEDSSEYSAIGTYIGERIVDKIPVFEGFSFPSNEDFAILGASMACAGGVAMFHAAGFTPEAPTVDAAFGGDTVYDVIEITKNEIEQGFIRATNAESREIDLVVLGCPHLNIRQVAGISKKLEGRKVKDGVSLWLQTNAFVRGMSEQLGYADIIKKAGGTLVQDTCACLCYPNLMGYKNMATDSAKIALYIPGSSGMEVWCGRTNVCLESAFSGQFQG